MKHKNETAPSELVLLARVPHTFTVYAVRTNISVGRVSLFILISVIATENVPEKYSNFNRPALIRRSKYTIVLSNTVFLTPRYLYNGKQYKNNKIMVIKRNDVFAKSNVDKYFA